jgi:nucleotide-binding universal stress UspA family protein
MFRHILVPLDGSPLAECVLPHIVAVTQAFEANVTLIQVLERSRNGRGVPMVDPMDWQIAERQAAAYLDGVAARLEKAGIESANIVVEGSAAERVIEYAHANDVDLIALSSHGKSGLSGWNVSSVVQKIVQRAHRSILLVRAYQPLLGELEGLIYQRLLIPFDGSQRAQCVISSTVALARAYDAEVLLAHVVRRPETPCQIHRTEEDIRLADRLTERNWQEANIHLRDIKSQLPVRAEIRLSVSDDVATALHELMEREKVDLVILSAHGRSGVSRWPYGGLTTNLICYGNTPLLIHQDFAKGEIEPSHAELAIKEHQGH